MPIKTVVFSCLLCVATFAQSPDAVKYAPRPILLLDGTPGVEGVMPMIFTENGQQHLEFVLGSKIKESMDKGGKPIRLGDVLAALNGATEKINQLQAENDKLWKLAMKDSPQTVVVQQSTPGPSQAEIAAQQANARRQLALQALLLMQGRSQPQPYQLPMPMNPNANRLQTNCTTYRWGDMTHTSCN